MASSESRLMPPWPSEVQLSEQERTHFFFFFFFLKIFNIVYQHSQNGCRLAALLVYRERLSCEKLQVSNVGLSRITHKNTKSYIMFIFSKRRYSTFTSCWFKQGKFMKLDHKECSDECYKHVEVNMMKQGGEKENCVIYRTSVKKYESQNFHQGTNLFSWRSRCDGFVCIKLCLLQFNFIL